MVQSISSLGIQRFMQVYSQHLTKPAQRFALHANKFVLKEDLHGVKGDVAYTMAMLHCRGYISI